MTKTTHTVVAALFAAAFTASAFAGQTTAKTEASKPTRSDLTGYLETSWTSNYVFQGVKLDSNPTFVPKIGLQYPLFEGGTLQATAEQVVGTQGSTWFRSQYNVGLALDFGRLKVTPGYQVVNWPNGDGGNAQWVTGRFAFDDSGLTPVALQPHVLVNYSTEPRVGTYYEAGVSPGTTLGGLEVRFPVAVGVGAGGYFDATSNGVNYAFTSAGVALSYNLTPTLALKAGGTYYNTDSKLGNSGTGKFVTTTVGVVASF